jgi:phosphate/sulfate permease
VYNNFTVAASGAEVPKWILAMGGTGIVLGLATYGEFELRSCLEAA